MGYPVVFLEPPLNSGHILQTPPLNQMILILNVSKKLCNAAELLKFDPDFVIV